MRVLLIGALALVACRASPVANSDASPPADAPTADPDAGPDAIPGPPGLIDSGIDTTGLVAYWALDADSAMEGARLPSAPNIELDAFLELGGEVKDAAIAGVVGGAIALDGIDDRLVVEDADALDLTGPHSLTVWMRMNTLPVADYGLVGKQNAYALEIETDTSCGDYSVFGATTGLNELDPAGCALSVNEWHHLAAVYDGATMSLYQNGALVDTIGLDDSVVTNTGAFLIGDNTFAADRFLDGAVDEVSLWARALTATEISDLEAIQRP